MSKQRYEKEIEEILSKYDQETAPKEKKQQAGNAPYRELRPSAPPPVSGQPQGPPRVPGMPNWKRLSSGQYIAGAFGAALLAVLVRQFSPALASILVILSVVLFIVPIILYRSTGTSSGGWSTHEEKRWRGQVIDFNTRRNLTDDPLAGIKRWLRRR